MDLTEYRRSVDKEDLKDDGTVYYGYVDTNTEGAYIELPFCTYSDYSGTVVERANCDVFLEQYKELDGVYEIYGGYGTRGVLRPSKANSRCFRSCFLKNQ